MFVWMIWWWWWCVDTYPVRDDCSMTHRQKKNRWIFFQYDKHKCRMMWSNLNLANEVATKRIIFCGLSLIRAVSAGSDFSLDSAVFSLQLFFFIDSITIFTLFHRNHFKSSSFLISCEIFCLSCAPSKVLSLARDEVFQIKKTTDWENINILFSFYWCSEARSNKMPPTMMRSHLSPSVTKFFLWSREIGYDKEWHRVDD